MMGLPKQVQRQADEAARFDKEVAAAAAATAAPTAETPPDETPKPPAEEATQTPEVTTTQPAKPPETDGLWEQRFKSLQGMYNSQVPALQHELRTLKAQLTAPTKPEAPPAPPAESVTKTDVEAFGADLIDVSRRVARDEIARATNGFADRLARLEAGLTKAGEEVGAVVQRQEVSDADRFYSGLAQALPKWETIQETPECQKWLTSAVPGTRFTWNQVLVDAANRYDLSKALEVFGEFIQKHPHFAPKAPAPTPPQPPGPSKSRTELQRQVAPAKSGSSGAPLQEQKRTYTGIEFERESMRQVRLTQAGNLEAAARLEAELNSALEEGRVHA